MRRLLPFWKKCYHSYLLMVSLWRKANLCCQQVDQPKKVNGAIVFFMYLAFCSDSALIAARICASVSRRTNLTGATVAVVLAFSSSAGNQSISDVTSGTSANGAVFSGSVVTRSALGVSSARIR